MACVFRPFIFLSEYKSVLILFYLFYLPVQTKSNALYLNVLVDIFSKNTQISRHKNSSDLFYAGRYKDVQTIRYTDG